MNGTDKKTHCSSRVLRIENVGFVDMIHYLEGICDPFDMIGNVKFTIYNFTLSSISCRYVVLLQLTNELCAAKISQRKNHNHVYYKILAHPLSHIVIRVPIEPNT